jgi:ribonucleoside-diphosphate reductase alpha chain
LRRGANGKPIETVEEMFYRVASHIAKVEEENGGDVEGMTVAFYELLTKLKFMPNSPTFTGAGTPLGQLAACFVLPISDDMGRDPAGIFQTLRDAALIQQTGGGNGFAFSRLRPKGALVNSSAGQATGPVGFLRVYDQAFGEIAQGGTRRGANMAVLRVDHPDIRDFVQCKTDENQITNFNISVGVTDKFMEAVKADKEFELIDPHSGEVWETVRAVELFEMIVRQAHHNGEPGMLFLDAANRHNPVPHLYELEATNPCGEQWLGPYENCCLGSINLARHAGPDGTVDWDDLRETIELTTRFLDNVVTANAYVPAVPQLAEAALRARRIGLGIMGLSDLMYHAGVRYGSEEAQEFAAQVMEFVRYHCMSTSIALAKDRGPFPAIKGSIYDPEDMSWEPPSPLVPYDRHFGRPSLQWDNIVKGIREHGIRNAAQTTVAPTGTIATVAGCEGYGCEPVFALAYVRHVNDNGNDLQLQYTSPLFDKALLEAGLDEVERAEIVEEVNAVGSCQSIEAIPDAIRDVFVVASDISPEEHVRMQAAIQAFVDNSISKTCNFPRSATEADVAEAYQLAWQLGCKGLTVYVTGSREKVVLETQATKSKKKQVLEQTSLWPESKKPRAGILRGETHRVTTPLGNAYVTINENGNQHPFEVFIQTSKAGSDTAAVSEAIGRLVSYILRLSSPVAPQKRLREVVKQLSGIGGGRPLGFGSNRVLSLPDGVAQALDEYLRESPHDSSKSNGQLPKQIADVLFGDLCPECGEAALVNEEGCRKCYGCGFSEC